MTNRDQGGGAKLQGLASGIGHRVDNANAIRKYAGGDKRNWFFLSNGLSGSVGRRGQLINAHSNGAARGGPKGIGPWGNN